MNSNLFGIDESARMKLFEVRKGIYSFEPKVDTDTEEPPVIIVDPYNGGHMTSEWVRVSSSSDRSVKRKNDTSDQQLETYYEERARFGEDTELQREDRAINYLKNMDDFFETYKGNILVLNMRGGEDSFNFNDYCITGNHIYGFLGREKRTYLVGVSSGMEAEPWGYNYLIDTNWRNVVRFVKKLNEKHPERPVKMSGRWVTSPAIECNKTMDKQKWKDTFVRGWGGDHFKWFRRRLPKNHPLYKVAAGQLSHAAYELAMKDIPIEFLEPITIVEG